MTTEVYKDSTSHSPFFELVDSTTGLPKTGVLYTDVTASYARTRGARTAITPATLASASASWSSGGFILVDDTNQPGIVRFDVPNAAFATGVEEVVVTIKATGCRTVSRGFTLIDINKQDPVRAGMTALPNAAAEAAGGLYTRGTGAGQINQPANGMIDTNPVRLGGAAQSLTDLKDFADTGYDPVTHKVQGVVLVDTTTTNTDMRGTDGAYTGTPPTASAISTQVNSDLTTAHGAGSYQTATGFSTHSAADVWAVATRTLSGTLGSFDAIWTKIKNWLGALAGKTADLTTLAEIQATTAGVGYENTTDSLQAIRDNQSAGSVTVMPVSGAATIGNVLEGGRIIGQFGAPLVGLTITCTTTSAGVTSARDLTAYDGNLSLVVFDNDEAAAVSSRVVQGANITVASNIATVSSTASSALNTVVSSELRWELRETGAAPSIVFAKGAYVCERAPLSTG